MDTKSKVRARSRNASVSKATTRNVSSSKTKKLQKMRKQAAIASTNKTEVDLEDDFYLQGKEWTDFCCTWVCAFDGVGFTVWGAFLDKDRQMSIFDVEIPKVLCLALVIACSSLSNCFGGGGLFAFAGWALESLFMRMKGSKISVPRPSFAFEDKRQWGMVFLGAASAILLDDAMLPVAKTRFWLLVFCTHLAVLYVWAVSLVVGKMRRLGHLRTKFEIGVVAPTLCILGGIIYTGGCTFVRDPILTVVYGRAEYFQFNLSSYQVLYAYTPVGIFFELKKWKFMSIEHMMIVVACASLTP